MSDLRYAINMANIDTIVKLFYCLPGSDGGNAAGGSEGNTGDHIDNLNNRH